MRLLSSWEGAEELVKNIRLAAVGDICLADSPQAVGAGVLSVMKKRGPDYPFRTVKDFLRGHDIVFGNLESTISSDGLVPGKLESEEMRSIPQSAEVLSDAGFTVLNVANNHSLQHGGAAFEETCRLLQNRNIQPIGVAQKPGSSEICIPRIVKCQGVTFGFLGFAFEPDAYFSGDPLYAQGRVEEICRQTRELAKTSDIVIVSCHWGLEFMDRPSALTIQIARRIVDSGARVVLGHHSHVLQGAEDYHGGCIVYSLGNFVFDMLWQERFRKSAIVSFEFSRGGVSWGYRPVRINSFFQPVFLEDAALRSAVSEIQELCRRAPSELAGDISKNSIKYYQEYENLRKRNRLLAYRYFVRRSRHLPPTFILQTLVRTLFRRFTGS